MFSGKWIKYGLMVFSLFFFVTYVMELDAYARAGGGRSSGSRGSRSYSSPSSPSSSPSSPSRQSAAAPSAPAPSPGGGFMRGIAGGIVGGMIGGMLFRSLGFGGGDGIGGGGGGIGIFEIILIAGLLYGIWWYIKKRRREAEETANPAAYRTSSMPVEQPQGFTPSYGQQPSAGSDIAGGIGYVRQMDQNFDEQKFKEQCTDAFFKVQGAWANRDMSGIRNMLTDEMYRILQGDADDLKKKKQINKLDNIAVRSVELSEVWQEAGNDFITVRFAANLLDYTTDETTGSVVAGSKTEPVKFEEFWTYTRPIGNNPWQLSAINQPS